MKIQVGRKYRTRGGEVAEIKSIMHPQHAYPVHGHIGGTPNAWLANGRWKDGEEDIWDLVEDLGPILSLQVGSYNTSPHGADLIQECASDGTPIATHQQKDLCATEVGLVDQSSPSRDTCLAEFWMSLNRSLSKAGIDIELIDSTTTVMELASMAADKGLRFKHDDGGVVK